MSQVRDPEAIAREAEAQRLRRAKLPAVLDYAFRPMFLAAGSWAGIALALWFAMFFAYVQLPTRFDPLAWHVHEMLFGFVMAAVAGFLLTAIPNWTGRLPVRGYPLATLASLWLVGRIACLISADLPAWLAVLADLAFPVALLAVAAREIITGRNWRNLPMTAPLVLFIVADLLMHLESRRFLRPCRTRLAARGRRSHPADLGDWRAHHSELHPQLAVQAQESSSSFTPEHARYDGGWRACGCSHTLGVSPRSSRHRGVPYCRRHR